MFSDMTELPLPFAPHFLLPFILAWRATPEQVSRITRAPPPRVRA
jgi:hypothetical protein